MIQWIDYLEFNVFNKIMDLLIKFRDECVNKIDCVENASDDLTTRSGYSSMKISTARSTFEIEPNSIHRGIKDTTADPLDLTDLNYRLLFLTDSQGVIVTTYYTFYKQGLYKTYAEYLRNDRDDYYLGKILGYPASGEIELYSGDMKYIERDEQTPGRYGFSIYAITYGSGYRQILANIYRSTRSREALYDLYRKIVEALKIYDSDSEVLIEDEQGSLLSSNKTIPEIETVKMKIIKEQEEERDKFINDLKLVSKNWNTEFDRIFEQGFFYRVCNDILS
ncbi:Hypothetical protein HVR_LOCUS1239 [uncultured virus]|nr:Hypothetical protein HVR_LOCUS1239 [uncultured virus]